VDSGGIPLYCGHAGLAIHISRAFKSPSKIALDNQIKVFYSYVEVTSCATLKGASIDILPSLKEGDS
jgi:hypothetical protein